MTTGTAQVTRTANSQNGTVSLTTVNTLRGNMASGKVLYAADVNSLISMYNTMVGHTHTYTDAYQLATFGNNGDRNNYTENKTTTAPVSAAGIAGVTANTVVYASQHNSIAAQSRILQSHYHQINDRTS